MIARKMVLETVISALNVGGGGGRGGGERERGQNSNQAQILGLAMGPQQISKVSHMYVSTILVSWCCMCKGAGRLEIICCCIMLL